MMNYNETWLQEDSGWIGGNRSFFNVDVDDVDTERYPVFKSAPHFSCELEAGSCLFIPPGMLHQVNSADGRNLAVNIWCEPIREFNATVKVSDLMLSSLTWKGLPDVPEYGDPVEPVPITSEKRDEL